MITGAVLGELDDLPVGTLAESLSELGDLRDNRELGGFLARAGALFEKPSLGSVRDGLPGFLARTGLFEKTSLGLGDGHSGSVLGDGRPDHNFRGTIFYEEHWHQEYWCQH